jgi:hypothetical protein
MQESVAILRPVLFELYRVEAVPTEVRSLASRPLRQNDLAAIRIFHAFELVRQSAELFPLFICGGACLIECMRVLHGDAAD